MSIFTSHSSFKNVNINNTRTGIIDILKTMTSEAVPSLLCEAIKGARLNHLVIKNNLTKCNVIE